MRFINSELIEDGDKYHELLPLYNKWYNRTMFLSVGNTNVPEWNELVTYCKNNKTETAHFFLDLIDVYELQHKEGIRADNFVGGDFRQNKYVGYIKKYLNR